MAEKTIKQVLEESELRREIGWENGGLYTPDELTVGVQSYGMENELTQLVDRLISMSKIDRGHEILHCFDVGFGAAKLTKQIAQDGGAMQALGIENVSEDHIKAAFITGLLHDAMLSMSNDALRKNILKQDIVALVKQSEVPKFARIVPYGKDAVGDDLRGVVLLEKYGQAISKKVRTLARADLLAGADLQVTAGAMELVGAVSPYKVLDAVWYHDGNFPVRGMAEAAIVLGDRVTLYRAEKLSIGHVIAGIDKLLSYTEEDPNWEKRETQVDVPYLEKMIAKKAGPFMKRIIGTKTYDFVVEELAAQQRGLRTVQSVAFRNGIHEAGLILQEARELFTGDNAKKIEILQGRYETVVAMLRDSQ
ncbi:MAG: hypothetical protein AABX98_05345 [Nanoarchaeota archaeon]